MRLLLPPVTDPEPVAVATCAADVDVRLVSVRSPLDEAARPRDEGPTERPTSLPDPRGFAGPLVLAAQEALTGARPLAQLTRWVTPELYGRLADALPSTRTTSGRRATVLSVRAVPVSPTAAEVTVVLHDGQRVRAAATRVEEHRGRWRATALDIG